MDKTNAPPATAHPSDARKSRADRSGVRRPPSGICALFTLHGRCADRRPNRQHIGCNIENASRATCCAERTAVFRAIADGAGQIRRIAVVSDSDAPCMPCGICRQVLAEFAAPDFELYAAQPDGRCRRYTIDELLPEAFLFERD